MSSNIYTAGLRNVGSYQVSGQPYLSGTVTSATIGSSSWFRFPSVTKKVIVSNEDSSNKAIISFVPYGQTQATTEGFTNSASGSGNWLYLSKNSSIELDVKCKEIFIAPAAGVAVDFVTVYAELTGIPTGSMYSFDGLEGIST
jgi:hypothetical protein